MAQVEERVAEAAVDEAEVGRPAAPAPARATFLTVLRNAGFRNLWLGQIISQIGDYFVFLALMVVVSGFQSDAAATTSALAGLGVSMTLPRLLFGVLAGVFVDRWDRRRTMLVSDLVRVGIALAFIPAILAQELLLIYALAFALSAIGTLFVPAKGALIPWLVPDEQLTAANALSQTSQMLAQFAGPALAGATFAAVGSGNQWIAFAIDGVSFLVSALAIWLIRVPRTNSMPIVAPRSETPGAAVRQVWRELLVGLRALVLNRTIATLAAVFAVLNLGLGALNVLWVVYLRTQFHFADADLAWRISVVDIAFAGAMVVSSALIGNVAAQVSPKWMIVVGLIGGGLLLSTIGYLPDYWLLVAAMAGVGLFVAPIMTGTPTMMQIVVPNAQLGRVGGGIGTVSDTSGLVSMGLAGVLGGLLGIPLVFFLSGLLATLAGVLGWVRLPALTLRDKVADMPLPTAVEIPADQAA